MKVVKGKHFYERGRAFIMEKSKGKKEEVRGEETWPEIDEEED